MHFKNVKNGNWSKLDLIFHKKKIKKNVLLLFEKTKIIFFNCEVYFMVVFAKAFNSFAYSNTRQMLQMIYNR